MKPLISLVIELSQTYENFEVILVDDGSTDMSGEMCDKYALKDSRVKAYHKANGGLSDARNFGVCKAAGDLISFVDSDDYVTEDYVEYLYDLMERYNVDLSCAGKMDVYNAESLQLRNREIIETVLPTEASLKNMCDTSVSACVRLYKKDLLLKYPYPLGRLFEDLATTCKIIGDCRRVAFSNKIIYFYVLRRGSLSHSVINEKQYDVFWAAKEQLDYISKVCPGALVAAQIRYVKETMNFLTRLFLSKTKEKKYHFQRVRNLVMPYIRVPIMDNRTSINVKVSSLAICMGYIPSEFLWLLKRIVKRFLRGTAI